MTDLHAHEMPTNTLRKYTLGAAAGAKLIAIVASCPPGYHGDCDPVYRDRLNGFWMEQGKAMGFRWSTVTDVIENGGLHLFRAEPDVAQTAPDMEAKKWVIKNAPRLGSTDFNQLAAAFNAGRDRGFAMGSAAPADDTVKEAYTMALANIASAAEPLRELLGIEWAEPTVAVIQAAIERIEALDQPLKRLREAMKPTRSTSDAELVTAAARRILPVICINDCPDSITVDVQRNAETGEITITPSLAPAKPFNRLGDSAAMAPAIHDAPKRTEFEQLLAERSSGVIRLQNGNTANMAELEQLLIDAMPAVAFVNGLATLEDDQIGFAGITVEQIRTQARGALGDDGFKVPPTYTEAQRDAAGRMYSQAVYNGHGLSECIDLVAEVLGMRKVEA